jgi:alkanesulfonate monooxygenase SsuD/methylene tetrahydromethanopterin reductase-like flavin-dependent oxidoreductase (luciferase family)
VGAARLTGDFPLLGFGLPVSGRWATPATICHTARRAEELGYASLWTFQRLLYPVSGGLDPPHESVLDPVVPLAFVAGHTDRIRLGTATICAPFAAPVLLAKMLASLDVLCAGRLTVGVGMGWLPQEYIAAGVPYERRGKRMDEYLRCLKALWTDDPVEFAGDTSTPCRGRAWHRRPCSDRTRRSWWAALLRRRCAAPDGSPRAGSAAASRT